MKISIQKLKSQDIQSFFNKLNQDNSSFNSLGSVLGYSLTELYLENTTLQTKIKNYLFEKNSSLFGIIKLKEIDDKSKNTTFQMAFVNENYIDHNCINTQFLNFVKNLNKRLRCITYIFPHETHIRNILENAGFELEGTLKKHIYTQGQYLDLLIMGTKRRVAL